MEKSQHEQVKDNARQAFNDLLGHLEALTQRYIDAERLIMKIGKMNDIQLIFFARTEIKKYIDEVLRKYDF